MRGYFLTSLNSLSKCLWGFHGYVSTAYPYNQRGAAAVHLSSCAVKGEHSGVLSIVAVCPRQVLAACSSLKREAP